MPFLIYNMIDAIDINHINKSTLGLPMIVKSVK